MTPFYTDPLVTLYLGDCLDVMADLPDESVDAIVTDPPYGLSFMGKHWDHGVPGVDFWREMYRVAKPGAHLLSFGGTRTVHRIATNIEEAGWEIRDLLMHIFASGFPKSLDVGKALDKANGREFEDRFALGRHIRERRTALGLSAAGVNEWFGYRDGCQHWERQDRSGARVPTLSDWTTLRERLGLSDEWLPLIERAEAEREKIGERDSGLDKGSGTTVSFDGSKGRNANGLIDVTAPATDLARQWDGWGTALKPAHEPIVMARKPLVGTVAGNVARFGTGALNIGATRIPGTGAQKYTVKRLKPGATLNKTGGNWRPEEGGVEYHGETQAGRWPSNVMLSDAELFDSPNPEVVGSGAVSASGSRTGEYSGSGAWSGPFGSVDRDIEGDAGGYSRFFRIPEGPSRHSLDGGSETPSDESRQAQTTNGHVPSDYPKAFIIPKSDRAERERGLAGAPTGKVGGRNRADGRQWDIPGSTVANGKPDRANTHPTVKPIDLMRHLVRLVTPPGGVCLDPFLGSGTTALAASEEGMRCIGIERELEYLEIAKGRLIATPMGLGLDVGAPVRKRTTVGDAPMNRLRESIAEKGRRPHSVDGWNFGKNTLPDEEPAA